MILSFEEFKNYKTEKKLYGLFGNPLSHTISPSLHKLFFSMLNLEQEYVAIDVKPEEFDQAVDLAKYKLAGFNVTIPYKVDIKSHVYLDDNMKKIGSVNTVNALDGKLLGYNTDYLAFIECLKHDCIDVKNQNVICLGYGGTARVICYALLQLGANLTICGRNIDKANSLKDSLLTVYMDKKINTCTLENISENTDIMINCTSVGMYPNISDKIINNVPNSVYYMYDCIYNPYKTSFLENGNNREIKVRNGLLMLIYQGAFAQQIWNNVEFDISQIEYVYNQLKLLI